MFRCNNDFFRTRIQPCPPPTESAVGDDEVIALGHQPQIRVGVFIAPVVRDQGDPLIGQWDACAGGFGLVREDEVMRCGREVLHRFYCTAVVVAGGVVNAG